MGCMPRAHFPSAFHMPRVHQVRVPTGAPGCMSIDCSPTPHGRPQHRSGARWQLGPKSSAQGSGFAQHTLWRVGLGFEGYPSGSFGFCVMPMLHLRLAWPCLTRPLGVKRSLAELEPLLPATLLPLLRFPPSSFSSRAHVLGAALSDILQADGSTKKAKCLTISAP